MMLDVTAELIAEWHDELARLTGSLGNLFNRPEPRVVFAQFIEGLLAELPKKNGWTLSERAGHATADRMQWLLNGSVWDADQLRDEVRDYVVEHLGDADITGQTTSEKRCRPQSPQRLLERTPTPTHHHLIGRCPRRVPTSKGPTT